MLYISLELFFQTDLYYLSTIRKLTLGLVRTKGKYFYTIFKDDLNVDLNKN